MLPNVEEYDGRLEKDLSMLTSSGQPCGPQKILWVIDRCENNVSTAYVRTRVSDHSFSDVTIRVLVMLTNANDLAMLGKSAF